MRDSLDLQMLTATYAENSVPPMAIATLIAAQHLRPVQPLPLLFAPVLLFTSYMNLRGYKTDAAGASAAWAGLYMLLASRRTQVRSCPRSVVDTRADERYPGATDEAYDQRSGARCYHGGVRSAARRGRGGVCVWKEGGRGA